MYVLILCVCGLLKEPFYMYYMYGLIMVVCGLLNTLWGTNSDWNSSATCPAVCVDNNYTDPWTLTTANTRLFPTTYV